MMAVLAAPLPTISMVPELSSPRDSITTVVPFPTAHWKNKPFLAS